MNIRHLKIFRTVCEEGGITKAAERLHITQPAVTNTINELESDLGICLFDRVSRRMQLNESGRLFLAKTLALLELFDDLEQGARKLDESAVIKIGSSISIASYLLPQALSKFQAEPSSPPTSVVVENAQNIENLVAQNMVDIGLVEGAVSHKGLVTIPLSSYSLACLCSPLHPLAHSDSIDLSRLLQEMLLLREKGSAIRDVFDSALLLQGLSAEPCWTSVNSGALIMAAKQNLGVTVLPKIKVSAELARGELLEIKIKSLKMSNSNQIIFLPGKYQNTSLLKLIAILKDISINCDLG